MRGEKLRQGKELMLLATTLLSCGLPRRQEQVHWHAHRTLRKRTKRGRAIDDVTVGERARQNQAKMYSM